MATTLANTKVAVDFLQFPVALYKASAGKERVELDSLCTCKGRPHQTIECDTVHPDAPVCTDLNCLERHLLDGEGKRRHLMTFASWFKLPLRGYPKDADKHDVVLTAEEIAAAKVKKQYDDLTCEKVVDLAPFMTEYATGEPVFVLPPKKADEKELRLYRIFVEVLDEQKRGMLTRFTQRGSTTRYLIVGNAAKNILVAYPVSDMRDLPYDVRSVPITDKDKVKANVFLDEAYSKDATFAPAEDGVVKLIEDRLLALRDRAAAPQQEASTAPPA